MRNRAGKSGIIVVVLVLLVGLGLAFFANVRRQQAPPAAPADLPAKAAAPETVRLPVSQTSPQEQEEARPVASGPKVTLTGRVTFAGDLPEVRQLPVTKDAGTCACGQPFKLDESIVIDPATRGVANAVVWIKGVQGGPSLPKAVIDQKGCAFSPHVVLVAAGQDLTVLNCNDKEPISHNFQIWSDHVPANVKNTTIPKFRKDITVPGGKGFETPEFIKVTCEVHPWMSAWVAVMENGWAARTDATGGFSIPDLPPGEYTLALWHETLAPGTISERITVDAGAASVGITLSRHP